MIALAVTAFAAPALAALVGAGSTVQGHVLEKDGTPVADARVVLGEFGHATLFYNSAWKTYVATPGIPDPESRRFAAELTTDAKGWFAAGGLAAGEFTVLASHAIYGVGLSTVRVAEGQGAEIEIRLVRSAYIDAQLSGFVFDPQRHTVELVPERNGTNVEFHPQLEPVPGTWSFKSARLPMEGWRIVGSEVVFQQDYRATLFSFPMRIAGEGAQAFSFDATKGIELQGSVADADGRPLAGVSVVARNLGSKVELGAVTDGQGSYRIRGLLPGKHVLEAMRWKLRDVAGCGNGPLELSASREIALPLADPALASFRIDRLLPVPKVGDPAPAFEVRTIEGRPVSLGALRGKVVLLDFWATWCGSCRVEMPKLLESYAKNGGGSRFEIIGVSLDTDPDRVPRFLASRHLAWPQTALGPEPGNPIATLFNVHSTPSTVLVDAAGRIAALNLLGEPLEKKIEALLAGG